MATLVWGETPWDSKSKEELLRDVQRMYDAIVAMNSCLHIIKYHDQQSPYWGPGGSGGRSLEMSRQVLAPIHAQYDESDIYRSFFRYATDLLFDQSMPIRTGSGWMICPVCGTMTGNPDRSPDIGEACRMTRNCTGITRALILDDLKATP